MQKSKLLICGDRNGVRAYTGSHKLGPHDFIQITGRDQLLGYRNNNVILVAGWGRLLTFGDIEEIGKIYGVTFTHDKG